MLEKKDIVNWLQNYGYFLEGEKKPSEISITEAVKRMQAFYGLHKDGILGPKTAYAMLQPRCGVADHQNLSLGAASLYKWNKNHLKFYITPDVPQQLSFAADDLLTVVSGSLGAWSAVCNIFFAPTENQAEADLIITSGHEDGPYNILAWCELPVNGTGPLTMKIDNSERWVKELSETQRGMIRLFNVLCHEFGHGIGLTHSKVPGALMAPTYSEKVAVPQVLDDVPRIVGRYGAVSVPTVPPITPIPPVTPPGVPIVVSEMSAVVNGQRYSFHA